MRIIKFDRFFPGAVGSGVTGFVANRYFTEALSERNYSKVEFFPALSSILLHVCENN